MTTGDAVDSERAFQDALCELLLSAAANGLTLEGGWAVAGDDGGGRWDVEIVELATDD
jgi:hypothetical protein